MADDIDRKAFSEMQYATTDKTAVDLLGNKPRITKENVHDMLMAAGFTPGLGNIADAADAILYAAEGEFGSAALSAAAIIPFIGQTVSAKRALKIAKESGEKIHTMWRGVKKWYPGEMVKEGKFVGGKDFPDQLWITDKKSYAKHISMEEGGVLLEFEVPESYMKEYFVNSTGLDRAGMRTGFFLEGLEKDFLIKVHK